jgi:hypothetical protein
VCEYFSAKDIDGGDVFLEFFAGSIFYSFFQLFVKLPNASAGQRKVQFNEAVFTSFTSLQVFTSRGKSNSMKLFLEAQSLFYDQLETGRPDWANFRLLGNCLHCAVFLHTTVHNFREMVQAR